MRVMDKCNSLCPICGGEVWAELLCDGYFRFACTVCGFTVFNKKVPDIVADMVNHPSHYETGKFECIDVMLETQGKEAVQSFCLCNAFKYLYRHKNKNGVEDIKKAAWYINKYLELEGDLNE